MRVMSKGSKGDLDHITPYYIATTGTGTDAVQMLVTAETTTVKAFSKTATSSYICASYHPLNRSANSYNLLCISIK